MAVPLVRHRVTIGEYHQMGEAGILTEDDRVELIEGEIVEMPPIGPPHAGGVIRLAQLFTDALGGRALVSQQNPVALSDHSEPQPDVTLLRPRADYYARSHPTPADVLLVVEVAETSVGSDRRVKLPLYARAGIPEAWLLDLPGDALEVHRQPSPEGYREVQRFRRGGRLAPQAFPELELRVDDLLGER